MKIRSILLGVAADCEPYSQTVSGMRGNMYGSHKKASSPLDNPEPRLKFTGADTEYHDYCFNDVASSTGLVMSYESNGVRKPAKIARTAGSGDGSPISTVIFTYSQAPGETVATVDCTEVESYTRHDHIFSSSLEQTDKLKNLQSNEQLTEGDVLTTLSSQVNGEFCDTVNLNTACMSSPDIIEDSYWISDYAADKMMSWGVKRFLHPIRDGEVMMNTYGTPFCPKYFPSKGELVRDDGLVMAFRNVDPAFAALEMSVTDMMDVAPHYDSAYYVDADPDQLNNHNDPDVGSRVIDIRVWRNEAQIRQRADGPLNTIFATNQNIEVLDREAKGLKNYYDEIMKFYIYQLTQNHGKIKFSPSASRVIGEALASESGNYVAEFRRINPRAKEAMRSIERMYRYAPISHYTIEVVVRYPIPVTVSSKMADTSGTKGVVGRVSKREDMPRDPITGEYVDVVRSSNATLRRSSYAGIYYIYNDAASKQMRAKMNSLIKDGYSRLQEAWEYMLGYMRKYNPDWADALDAVHGDDQKKIQLIQEMNDVGVRIYVPHELDNTPMGIVQSLAEYKPVKHQLEITNYDGTKELTKSKFYVGSIPTLRLDKTGREFSSIGAMRINHLGMISSSQHGGVAGYPVNNKAIKYAGASEQRLFEGYAPHVFDEMHFRANNEDAHKMIVRNLLLSKTPTNEPDLLSEWQGTRKSMAHEIVDHVHICEGHRFVKPVKE